MGEVFDIESSLYENTTKINYSNIIDPVYHTVYTMYIQSNLHEQINLLLIHVFCVPQRIFCFVYVYSNHTKYISIRVIASFSELFDKYRHFKTTAAPIVQ